MKERIRKFFSFLLPIILLLFKPKSKLKHCYQVVYVPKLRLNLLFFSYNEHKIFSII